MLNRYLFKLRISINLDISNPLASMTGSSHGAVGSALGYYYQAIYALILLFDSKDSNSYVSIESLDDVVLNDGARRELHQLKHSIQENTVISIKSDQLWKTLKVWCDFIKTNDPNSGIFTLSTVASISSTSPLIVLKDETLSRNVLELELLTEAQRVINERKEQAEKSSRALPGEKQVPLPYEVKYKGCQAFLELKPDTRSGLLKNMRLSTNTFSISQAEDAVIQRIQKTNKVEYHQSLAKSILAWWDREAVESLTRERNECIHLHELQEFISKKSAELYQDGFTDDLWDIAIPAISQEHPIQKQQLSIIGASKTQIARSYDTEMKARIQREKWINDNLSAASKLNKYDRKLIQEWSYKFEEYKSQKSTCNEEQLKENGRLLLDWSHEHAHNQVQPISRTYTNPDLIRGTYQILSRTLDVGWHCDYLVLINKNPTNE